MLSASIKLFALLCYQWWTSDCSCTLLCLKVNYLFFLSFVGSWQKNRSYLLVKYLQKWIGDLFCLPSDFLLSLPVKGSQRGQHPSSWLLLLFSPPEAVWERTWHVPYAVICSESLSCWPVCTISANLAYPGTGEERRGLSPAHNAARSSAPSSFKLTTLWQPWWRRSVSLPRMLTPRT